MARHREGTDGWLWILPSLLIPLIVAAYAWTAHVSSEGDEIAPNVKFAGIDISGLSADEAADEIAEREQQVMATPVVIEVDGDEITLNAEEIGYDYRFLDTVESAITARHGDGPFAEFAAWASTPFTTQEVDDVVVLDEQTARDRLSQRDFVVEDPVEPSITTEGKSYVHIVPGVNGVAVDIDKLVADLEASDIASGPVRLVAEEAVLPPSMDDATAAAIALDVNDKTRAGITVSIAADSAWLPPGVVRRNLVTNVEEGVMTVSVDSAGLRAEIEEVFNEPIGEFVAPEIEVVDGQIQVIAEGKPPAICCSAESVESVAMQVLNGESGPFMLETRPDDDPEIVAWADGSYITEPVATFTTNHPCCENRVVNIQTIADAVTGYYLIPGETLSFNDYVGPRTREKGYLPAGAIRSGHMTDEVGGGISQFITTMFNAAFYGGLDLDEYQSHSIYFSRYPFGREATMSIPGPDLVITNSTDYPVLIWPTYDSTSITVTLYSTKNVEVVELEHRISRRNLCRHSQIDRERTFSDGTVEVDTIVANYRPGDGLDCNGNEIPES